MLQELSILKLAKNGDLLFEEVEGENPCKPEEIALLINSFGSLGYCLSASDIKRLSKLDSKHLTDFYIKNYAWLEEICGDNVNHKVFYKNFPNVGDMSELEMYVRAILHYLTVSADSDGFMSQDIEDFEREVIHNPNKKLLKLISPLEGKKYVLKMVKDLFEGKVAMSYSDHFFAGEVVQDFATELNIKEIPFKENIGHYFTFLFNGKLDKKMSEVISKEALSFVKTPTDLLRVYSALSRGDLMLRQNVKFISLERSVRRMFLEMLNDMAKDNINIFDDFARHEFLWKKAFEKLHVGEYQSKYPFIAEVARKFRNDEYQTFYSKLDELFSNNNQVAYIKLIKTRPGEFARKLDMIIRNTNFDLEYTLNEFKSVADKVSTTLLLQLWEFFKNHNLYPTRIFKINKSRFVSLKEISDERAILSEKTTVLVLKMIEEALTEIYSTYEVKGKVYIDPKMKNYCLPRNSRNGSAQAKTLTYGTRIKLDPSIGNFIRLFSHFKNIGKDAESFDDGRVDLDLTVEFFNDEFGDKFSLGWHNLGSGREFNSFYSGDVTSAPEGASEFIDLDYVQARKYARYCVVTNTVYSGQDFADIPECFSGVMFMNELGKKGEIFNPEFVEMKFDLTQRGSNLNAAFAIDLETMELIWMDCPYTSGECCVAAELDDITLSLKDVLKEHMSLYDFLMLHKGHIEIVDSIDEADIIVSDDENATLKPFDVANIAANWL